MSGHGAGCACQCQLAPAASAPKGRPLKRRDFLRYAGAAAAAASMAPMTACFRSPSQASGDGKRVIVLAFDGMDWDLARRLISEGRMPNFRRMAASGLAQPLDTSIPPLSPVAWSNFVTGMDSGGHGIFDFVHRDPQTLRPYSSTSHTEDAGGFSIGGWRIPLGGGKVELLRHGTPFWEPLRDQGIDTTIVRMPANFPPTGTAGRELTGMGTPDILGTDGTFSFYSSDVPIRRRPSGSSGRYHPFNYERDVARAELHGPSNPFRSDTPDLTVPLQVFVDPVEPVALLRAGAEERVLQEGEWSDWVPVTFNMAPTQSLAAQARFYLKSVRPHVELYVSPVNIDPMSPGLPISAPGDYAGRLAEITDGFYTQGMPEETAATVDGVLTLDEFLEQADIVREEVEAQFHHVLEEFRSGLLFYYFGFTDQVSHIVWRSMDPDHPAYDPEVDPQYADVVPTLYERADWLVGRTLDRLGDDGTLVVMSDHGFTSFRRGFNLNTWLEQEGYLVLSGPPAEGRPSTLFTNIDWSQTRAYGIGINGLYVNVAGRERLGMVPPSETDYLLDEISSKLEGLVDPDTGEHVVRRVFGSRPSADSDFSDVAPDAVLGYNKTYRSSGVSGIGTLEADVLRDNRSPWSGDHAMDPDTVPGILFASRKLRRDVTSLQDLAAAILAEFGIDRFPA